MQRSYFHSKYHKLWKQQQQQKSTRSLKKKNLSQLIRFLNLIGFFDFKGSLTNKPKMQSKKKKNFFLVKKKIYERQVTTPSYWLFYFA